MAAHSEKPPVKASTDVVRVHTTVAERRLAAGHWLLSALPEPDRERARVQWRTAGVTLLPCGTLFAAVRLPGALVHAVAMSTKPADVEAVLDEALQGGPVICDRRRECSYYALVPAGVPGAWREAVDDWLRDGVAVFGRDAYVGVPEPDATEAHEGVSAYWAVPVDSPGTLCAPLRIARFIAAGTHLLAENAKIDAAAAAVAAFDPRHRSALSRW
ncbi:MULTISPECIES: hypothetical protein [unclassified Streptomyces]|uniref:hypothetical protein n=1 Tax=unclassified Streptomyces TaxID=2593676 RepID=UPI00331B1D31